MRRRIDPLVKGTAEQSVRRLLPRLRLRERVKAEDPPRRRVGLGLSWEVFEPHVEAYTIKEAAWLVTSIIDTTKDAIRNVIASALKEGAPVKEIASRFRDQYPFSASRAQLIARTETTRVTNGSRRESLAKFAQETGSIIEKTWLTARDDRVRDEHQELEGETARINDEFSNGLQEPGEPNCRCTLLYELVEFGSTSEE